MNVARIKISFELLAQAFGMPDGTEVLWAVSEPFNPVGQGMILVGVKHPDLPLVQEGRVMPMISPVISVDNDNLPREWIKWDWNTG